MVESKDGQMKINIDGEYGGDAPMLFKDLKQHLQIFANVDSIPDQALTALPDAPTKDKD